MEEIFNFIYDCIFKDLFFGKKILNKNCFYFSVKMLLIIEMCNFLFMWFLFIVDVIFFFFNMEFLVCFWVFWIMFIYVYLFVLKES